MTRCIDQKPKMAGKFCVMIDKVLTFLPIFMNFDGEDWVWEDQDSRLATWDLGRESLYWFPEEENDFKRTTKNYPSAH